MDKSEVSPTVLPPFEYKQEERASFKDVLANQTFDNTGLLSDRNFSSGFVIGTASSEFNDVSSPFKNVTGVTIDFELNRTSNVLLFGQFNTRFTTDAGADASASQGFYQVPIYNKVDLTNPIGVVGSSTASGVIVCSSFGWTLIFIQAVQTLEKGQYRVLLRHRPQTDANRTIVLPSSCSVGYVVLGT